MRRLSLAVLTVLTGLFAVACEPGYEVTASNPCDTDIRVGYNALNEPSVGKAIPQQVGAGSDLTWLTIGQWGPDPVYFILLSGPRKGDVLPRPTPHLVIPESACPKT